MVDYRSESYARRTTARSGRSITYTKPSGGTSRTSGSAYGSQPIIKGKPAVGSGTPEDPYREAPTKESTSDGVTVSPAFYKKYSSLASSGAISAVYAREAEASGAGGYSVPASTQYGEGRDYVKYAVKPVSGSIEPAPLSYALSRATGGFVGGVQEGFFHPAEAINELRLNPAGRRDVFEDPGLVAGVAGNYFLPKGIGRVAGVGVELGAGAIASKYGLQAATRASGVFMTGLGVVGVGAAGLEVLRASPSERPLVTARLGVQAAGFASGFGGSFSGVKESSATDLLSLRLSDQSVFPSTRYGSRVVYRTPDAIALSGSRQSSGVLSIFGRPTPVTIQDEVFASGDAFLSGSQGSRYTGPFLSRRVLSGSIGGKPFSLTQSRSGSALLDFEGGKAYFRDSEGLVGFYANTRSQAVVDPLGRHLTVLDTQGFSSSPAGLSGVKARSFLTPNILESDVFGYSRMLRSPFGEVGVSSERVFSESVFRASGFSRFRASLPEWQADAFLRLRGAAPVEGIPSQAVQNPSMSRLYTDPSLGLLSSFSEAGVVSSPPRLTFPRGGVRGVAFPSEGFGIEPFRGIGGGGFSFGAGLLGGAVGAVAFVQPQASLPSVAPSFGRSPVLGSVPSSVNRFVSVPSVSGVSPDVDRVPLVGFSRPPGQVTDNVLVPLPSISSVTLPSPPPPSPPPPFVGGFLPVIPGGIPGASSRRPSRGPQPSYGYDPSLVFLEFGRGAPGTGINPFSGIGTRSFLEPRRRR